MAMTGKHNTTPAIDEPLDAWHTHSAAEQAQDAHTNEVPAFRVLGFGLVLYMAVVATIVVITVYFLTYASAAQVSREEYPERYGNETQAVQHKQLGDRRAILEGQFTNAQSEWTDPEAGLVRLPMAKAMEKVVAKYAVRK